MFDSSALDTYLTGLCEKKALPGVSAAILGPNGLEYAFNYGCRDGASLHPVDNDTLFGIASMSKSMTALCACILACEGKLDLNAPVSDFFPEFELAGQPREAATVRMLAMHTAGIPLIFARVNRRGFDFAENPVAAALAGSSVSVPIETFPSATRVRNLIAALYRLR